MRIDQQMAKRLIAPNSHVLDLGCGDGEMLEHLQAEYGVTGYGIEIDPDKITRAVGRGLSIIEQDLNLGLAQFDDASFDTVIMAQALQAVDEPDKLLLDMLRVAQQAIITFPNFAHWKSRYYLGVKGLMPVSETLPHEWYNTPNIHLCTFKDFDKLCADNGIRIIKRYGVDSEQAGSWLTKTMPNLFAEVAIYQVEKAKSKLEAT